MTIRTSETIINLSKALVETQKELKQPLKDAKNPFFKSEYVPLENVAEAITESATKHGLAFSQYATTTETGNVSVGTIVFHESGEYIEYPPLILKPENTKPQSIGSAITYAKRYSLSAVFGITSDKDDDGSKANGNGEQQKQPQKRNQKQAQNDEPDVHAIVEKYVQQLAVLGVKRADVVEYVCNKHNVGNMFDIQPNILVGEIKQIWLKKSNEARAKYEEQNEKGIDSEW
nr:MAG TPA: ERF superfamily protein [Caudoviricetes sp.]DAT25490.1 MAG TPA: ERF superfamily protein [Caudoviricetes sp.]